MIKDDLISRQAAVVRIDAIFPVDPMKTEYAQGIACGAALAKTYIKQLPPAQPQRKKGKWVWNQYDKPHIGNYHCSVCRNIAIEKYTYCPSCGADMMGESDEMQ